MPGVVYQDYPHAKLIVLWGVNPSASGIHLVPFVKEAQAAGATLVVIDPRATSLAKKADLHLAVRPGTDLPVALALHRVMFEEGHADKAFLEKHTHGADRLRDRRLRRGRSSARPRRPASTAGAPRGSPISTSQSSPALVRCGWGLERNRNGGNAAAAVLALPSVGGKFGVRGGGYLDDQLAGVRPEVGAVDRRARAADARW